MTAGLGSSSPNVSSDVQTTVTSVVSTPWLEFHRPFSDVVSEDAVCGSALLLGQTDAHFAAVGRGSQVGFS